MAIIFTAVRYRRLTEAAGTPGDLGYIGRRAIFDRRLGKQIDFSRFADDLVYDHLWLPDDAPPEFGNVEYFANAVDAAEMARIRSNLDDLSRKPQTGTAMITALPSDREITLDESQELAWRIVSVVRQGYRLPIHLAIHEPALKLRGALNRHAHAFIVGRELEPFGFALTKLRKDTAAIRTQGGSSFVADAIHWPDKTWEIVRTALLELGTDLVVDLIAPLPQAHLTMSRSGRTPGKIGLYRALLKDGNLAAIQGTPCDLLAKLLRGRSQIEIKELRGMVAKFIDAQADRDAAVDRILANNDIVTLADTANPRTPRFVTTAAAHSAIEYAVDLVDRSKQGSGMIHAAVGNGHAAVVAAIHDVLDDNSLTLSEGGLLIIGNRRSDCDEMSASFEAAKPEVAPVAAVLARRSAKAGQRSRPEFPAKGLVIIPRAEHIRDQDLASLLELAENFETQVVLGKDLTQESGIVANRLASYAADRLTSRRSLSKHVVSAEQLLRAGLTTAAIGRMADHLSFASLKRPVANPDRFDFVVCTNGNAVRAADKKLASIYGQTCVGDGNSSFTVDLARGPAELWPGQPVVFTRTDYSELPPRIREGQLATIVSINRQKSTLRVELPDGTTALIKTKKFPWFRSAFALSIREARQLKGLAKLRIELGDARCAWAALILAAMQTLPVSIIIDPVVAGSMSSFASLLSGSLPGALPTELEHKPDWNAEASEIINAFELETIPEPTFPTMPERVQFIRRLLVAGDVRELLAGDREAARGFELLCQQLHPENQYREATAKKLRSFCHPDGLTYYLVGRILEVYGATPEAASEETEDDIDMPRELTRTNPRRWDEMDLALLRGDLFAMTVPGSNLDIRSIEAVKATSAQPR